MSNRREFLGMVVGAATATVAAATSMSARGQPAKLEASDPTAQALGFTADASNADKARFATYAPGQTCAGCQLYQGKPTDAMAPCATFGGKLVPGKGWCSAFTKRA